MRRLAWVWPLTLATTMAAAMVAGCGGSSAPETNRRLRAVPLTSGQDLTAYGVADEAGDRLNAWSAEALGARERGEALSADDPILDGSAALEIDRLSEAADAAQSPELRDLLTSLHAAHEERLAWLVSGPKFAAKRYLRADRRVAELSFGLRRWRLQR